MLLIPGANEEEFNLGGAAEEEKEFVEDFSDYDPTENLIKEGNHPAVVIDFDEATSKKGAPMFVWEFRVTGGPSAGKTRKYYTSRSQAARFKLIEALDAVGVVQGGKIAKFRRGDVVGKAVIITVKHGTYNGQPSDDITNVLPPDEDAVTAAQSTPGM